MLLICALASWLVGSTPQDILDRSLSVLKKSRSAEVQVSVSAREPKRIWNWLLMEGGFHRDSLDGFTEFATPAELWLTNDSKKTFSHVTLPSQEATHPWYLIGFERFGNEPPLTATGKMRVQSYGKQQLFEIELENREYISVLIDSKTYLPAGYIELGAQSNTIFRYREVRLDVPATPEMFRWKAVEGWKETKG